MAATALDDAQEDMTTEAPPLPPLQPLLTTKAPEDAAAVKRSSAMPHAKRCSGLKTKKAGGGQCTRLVKITSEHTEDKVYCYSHLPKAQLLQRSIAVDKKVTLREEPTNHAERKQRTKKPVDSLSQEVPLQLVDNVHTHVYSKEDAPAIIEKAKSRRRRVDRAKEKAVVEQPVDHPTQADVQQPVIIHDCWQLWIGDHIAPKSKALIRQVMKDPVSDRDKAGYIYGFLLEDGPRVSQVEHAYFKIGRAENPQRRMYQVARSCNFIPKILEVIPKFPEKSSAQDKPAIADVDTSETSDGSSGSSSIAIETRCPMSHRVERLIHLELASQYERAGFKCDECGSTHREWFRVDRRRHPNGELMTDQELWHCDIRPIVLKWIQFGVVATALKS
ncbi:hypothetical protein MBANPS3_005891 [Mucor bainieri]